MRMHLRASATTACSHGDRDGSGEARTAAMKKETERLQAREIRDGGRREEI
jgi:hypothetical protein